MDSLFLVFWSNFILLLTFLLIANYPRFYLCNVYSGLRFLFSSICILFQFFTHLLFCQGGYVAFPANVEVDDITGEITKELEDPDLLQNRPPFQRALVISGIVLRHPPVPCRCSTLPYPTLPNIILAYPTPAC